jgi:hypothetical protein
MKKRPALFQKSFVFINTHKKLLAFVASFLILTLILFFINRSLFQSSVKQSNQANSVISKQLSLLSSDTSKSSSELANNITSTYEKLETELSQSALNYPKAFALATEPFSSGKREKINQLYRNSSDEQSYSEAIIKIGETQKLIQSLPDRNYISTNTDDFINQYNLAYIQLRDDKTQLDLTTITRITEIIRDSAEFYKSTNDLDIFYGRYDNVYSEMEKELLITYRSYLEDSVSFYNSYSFQLDSL